MTFEHTSKQKVLLLAVPAVLLIVGIFLLIDPRPAAPVGEEQPPADAYAGWETAAPEGITFRYPAALSTTYIRAFDWPPQVQVISGPFSCIETGSEIERAGRTEVRRVDGREYCVTRLSEGAAGSVYTQYAYAFVKGSGVVILTFSTRATQCGNYGDPERTACEGERETFDIDSVVDRIASSVTFE